MKKRDRKAVAVWLTAEQWALLKVRATLKNQTMQELVMQRIQRDLVPLTAEETAVD